MNEDSIKLLREVNSGCKNATDSFGQVMEFIKDNGMLAMVKEYNEKHVKIGDTCHQLLNENGENEKDPSSIAKAFMWFTTEVKMMVDDDDSHIAELLADGCNMGMKSLSRYIRQYEKAGQKEKELARHLIQIEMELYEKLLNYL